MRRIRNILLTSCNFLSSLLKLSSCPLLRTSGISCHSAKAEPRDERKELDGDRFDGDGIPSEPSSLSPSSSVPGSFPCCLWISLLMATSLYSWYRIAAKRASLFQQSTGRTLYRLEYLTVLEKTNTVSEANLQLGKNRDSRFELGTDGCVFRSSSMDFLRIL